MAPTVDPARWQRLEDVFVRALDVPASEQAAFVAAECSTDHALRDEILALLEDDRHARESLHDIVAAGARSAAQSRPVEHESSRPEPVPRAGLLGVMMTLLAILVACMLFGRYVLLDLFAGPAEGRELRSWMLESRDGGSAVAVTLPGSLVELLPKTTVDYTLRTTVTLAPEQRGRALALVVDCFHAPLSATVGGSPLITVGEGIGGGTWRFAIPEAHTLGETIQLELVVHRSPAGMPGLAVAPRLADDPYGDTRTRRVAAFNHYSAIASLAFLFMLAFLYLAMLVYEGAQRGYLALMLVAITSSNAPLGQVGFWQAVFGDYGLSVANVWGVANFLALVAFIRGAFQLSGVSRRWFVLGAAYSVVVLATASSYAATSAVNTVQGLLIVTVNLYVAYLCISAMRDPRLRGDAAVILYGGAPTLPCLAQGLVWVATGHSPLDGLHPYPLALMFSTASLSLILVRQHAARQRMIQQTAEELQRQVAERSKELATALAKLGEGSTVSLGRVIDDRYRVIRHIGTGGMGAVFEVERISDRNRFALKTVRERVDPRQMARLAREAQLAAQITHPNLVSVVDVGLADGTFYLVMELVDGGSLEDERARFGDVKWATPILEQIAIGLAALHEKGIVHRDLKPANILMSRGVARIADFGIASLYTSDVAQRLTLTGDVFGTPMYMAPELAVGSNTATPASDIFSVGVLACELLTKTRPFREPPILARAGAQLPPPETGGLDEQMRALIERCLDGDPTKRPSANELAKLFRSSR